ncbi:hypothetical protein Pve01_31290 [Planomonospora venezuelensis]|nr:hypothetical protein Pve01_31290 [Planomonospora venezuelensis]
MESAIFALGTRMTLIETPCLRVRDRERLGARRLARFDPSQCQPKRARKGMASAHPRAAEITRPALRGPPRARGGSRPEHPRSRPGAPGDSAAPARPDGPPGSLATVRACRGS